MIRDGGAWERLGGGSGSCWGVLRARRLCCLRRETAFSPESAAGSSESGPYRSPFCSSSREAQIVGGVLE